MIIKPIAARGTVSGTAYDTDLILVALGRLTRADVDDRSQAVLVAKRLSAAGVVDSPVVAIRAFGRFEVFVDDQPAPASAWKSRKARDLLRILVARRGRVVPRSELCELLWPDDEPLRTAACLVTVRVLPASSRTSWSKISFNDRTGSESKR